MTQKVELSLFPNLGADERCDGIHGGRDERHELLRVLPMCFAAVLCQPVRVGLECGQGLRMPAEREDLISSRARCTLVSIHLLSQENSIHCAGYSRTW